MHPIDNTNNGFFVNFTQKSYPEGRGDHDRAGTGSHVDLEEVSVALIMARTTPVNSKVISATQGYADGNRSLRFLISASYPIRSQIYQGFHILGTRAPKLN